MLPSLAGGGVERMRLVLAREFLDRGYRVDVVLVREEGALLTEVPDQARVVDLGGGRRLRGAVVPLARYLRAERPDAVLAAMWPLTTIALAAGLAAGHPRTVVSDHNVLSRQAIAQGGLRRAVLRASIRTLYPLASACVAVSGDVAHDVASLGGLDVSDMTVIPNPARPPMLPTAPDDPWAGLPTGARVLSVSRLKAQKDVPTLVQAFARVVDRRPATLVVLGDGPEREAVERLARDLGVADRVVLPGFVPETGPWYAHADVFALASRYEGFGNVLVEALAHGVQVVSTDGPGGPRTVLAGGAYGRLVPVGDPDALATAIGDALDEGQAGADGRRSRSRAFAPGPIADRYLDLLFP